MTTGVTSFDIGLLPHYPKLNTTKYCKIELLHKPWYHLSLTTRSRCNFRPPTSYHLLSSQDETTKYKYCCG